MEPSAGASRARGAPPIIQLARVAWTDAESARLLQLVEDFGSSDWSRIRDELNCSAWACSRTLQECEKQWRKVKSAEEKQAREGEASPQCPNEALIFRYCLTLSQPRPRSLTPACRFPSSRPNPPPHFGAQLIQHLSHQVPDRPYPPSRQKFPPSLSRLKH